MFQQEILEVVEEVLRIPAKMEVPQWQDLPGLFKDWHIGRTQRADPMLDKSGNTVGRVSTSQHAARLPLWCMCRHSSPKDYCPRT
jgi:hypothetical protein